MTKCRGKCAVYMGVGDDGCTRRRKKRTSEVVGMGGGGDRHPIGQNRGQEITKPVYKEKGGPRTRNEKKKNRLRIERGSLRDVDLTVGRGGRIQ